MRTRLIPLSLAAFTLSLTAWAQNAVPPGVTDLPPADQMPAAPDMIDENDDTAIAEPAPPEPAVVIADDVTASSVARARDTLSVDFPDEEIRNILRNVADLFELNLVIPDTLQGNTSIKLRDVTWRQIFEVVLAPVGYTFVEEGNIIKVVSQESLLQEPVSTDVFVINYARAGDLLGSIEPLIDTAVGGRIVVNARSNALVITERPSRLSRIRPIIEQLDKATDQVMIESKFVEVTDRDVKNIGVNWSSLSGYQVGVGGIGRTYDSTSGNTYSNESSTESVRENENTNESESSSGTDGSTTSGSTSTTTSTITTGGGATSTSTLANSLGSTNGTTSSSTDTVTAVNSLTDTINNLSSLIGTGGTQRSTTAVFSADEFALVLSALQSQNETKLVSNPTVVTLNNTEAQINVGAEYPIPNYTYNAERGTFEVAGFEYRPVGIILKVTPQVNAQGFIKLSIEPEVSSQNGFTSFGGAGGAQIPIIATRKAKTQVSLRDGYTMGIGGLIESNTSNGQTKVPLLGSIPGLGRLFRSDNKTEDSRNLLIFITAKTLSAEGASVEEVFDPRTVRRMKLRRDELPGFRDGSDPFLPAAEEDPE
ncbi:secretin N-terminal domain-containing protein [Actomonas aquatica]|uniref:Secretin N-terminal domain-containing protein n=1 Tax=Actomonas aquatica TaxID=2866162 RepID=A0ABZ1C8B5_9BACT|nr:secretin N-terminal domain-containing protein [Opitutus sp. WL0086]WRQ86799.1 secretin N-terminal domain-containing protein [Opitutus sp. WL0086]